MMKFRKYMFILLAIFTLSACSLTTDDVRDAVGKKVEEEAGKLVQKATDKAQKKVEEVLASGKNQVKKAADELSAGSGEKVSQPSGKIETGGTTDRIPVELIKITDGDTIRVLYDGSDIPVRFLLVDTPEVTKGQNQPFGKEATDRVKELLENGQVSLEFDVGERLDKYGRLLAYVYSDDVSVNELLVREGLARVAYVYAPNTRHLDAYEKAQQLAKDEGIGIWSIENYVHEKGFSDNK